uniref:NADH dehydrogenase subunit 3 n=1 Tax=Dixoniella grisea TaxID=35153 RepID=UPI001FCD8882|nr:NADH dehydrogenase subunit 3 [Dixoniella grisea]UNJ18986.1 NADH dehydrogenase subunit 3 [Dixoniella grisea]
MVLIYFEYSFVLFFLFISLFLAILIFILSYLLVPQNIDYQKISSYECGFNPFEDSRVQFSVKFYLIAILFLIFDLEVSLLFPWSLCVNQLSKVSFYYIILFLIVLTLGFVYEWYKGALDWD